jgi:serine phosphatase RsbU (regulator of sigma subunit)
LPNAYLSNWSEIMSATPQPAPSTQKLILIVDDTPTNLGVISGALADTYRTKVATSGQKALAIACAKDKPDLILLDVMMPEMDGYDVCTRLKADPATQEIPVIFLTGQTSVEDETRGFSVGAVDYVHKPFSPTIVKARVHNHIQLREARAQLAKQLDALNAELELAHEIQLSILPHQLPTLPGLEIAARFLPMASVGGDFYDFIPVGDKQLGILIADVSGHGLSSALIASMLQVALAGQVAHASHPDKVLVGLNRAVSGKFSNNFVTAAYVYVDLEANIMRYAGAGHPPFIQYRSATGRAGQIMENGLVLGFFEDASYDFLEIPLVPGDRHVLYTDGILEAANPAQEMYGAERLMHFLETNCSLNADQIADALLADVARWTEQSEEQNQQDDLTLLVFDSKRF